MTDLDRTVTDSRLRPVPSALDAIAQLRGHGVSTILATGRHLSEVRDRRWPLRVFDAAILEGGALAGRWDEIATPPAAPNVLADLARWLRSQGIPHTAGSASVSMRRADSRHLERFRDRARLTVRPNRDRTDITPAGRDKGSALDGLRKGGTVPAGHDVIAFGDADNDGPLFDAADYCVAVANAERSLAEKADEVTRLPGGRGVAEFLRRRVLRVLP